MAFHFCSDESAAEGLRRVFGERLDKALGLLAEPSAAEELAGAVHGARKEFKRLRALLRLARPALGRKCFAQENKVLRDAGRALSAVRDSQVLGGAFDGLVAASPGRIAAETVAKVRRGLQHHVAAVKKVTALEERVPPVLAELHALRERVAHWPLARNNDQEKEDDDGWAARLGDGLRTSYRRGHAALKEIEREGTSLDAPWHELRKRVKDLGYQLRLFRPVWPREMKALQREADRASEALGADHDLLVLRELLLDPKEPWATPEELETVTAVLDARRGQLQSKALEKTRRFFLEKPRRFEARLRGYWRIWRADKS